MSDQQQQSPSEPRVVHQNGSFIRVLAGEQTAERPSGQAQEPGVHWGTKSSIRVTVRPDGEQVVEQTGMHSHQSAAPVSARQDLLNTGQDQQGMPVPRERLTDDDLLDFHGTTRIKELIAMGVVERGPDGLLRVVGSQDQVRQQEQEPKSEEKKDEAFDPDWKDTIEGQLDGTSDDTDALLAMTRARMPESMIEGAIGAIVTEKDLSSFLPDAARVWGMEPEQAAEMFTASYSEFDRGARQAAAAVGVEDYDNGFWPWLSSDPDRAGTAIRALVSMDPRQLQKYARQYVREVGEGKIASPKPVESQEPALGPVSVSEIKNLRTDLEHDALLGPGLSHVRTDSAGTLLLYFSEGRSLPLDEAVDRGIVRVSRVPRK